MPTRTDVAERPGGERASEARPPPAMPRPTAGLAASRDIAGDSLVTSPPPSQAVRQHAAAPTSGIGQSPSNSGSLASVPYSGMTQLPLPRSATARKKQNRASRDADDRTASTALARQNSNASSLAVMVDGAAPQLHSSVVMSPFTDDEHDDDRLHEEEGLLDDNRRNSKPRILILMSDTGGGHRASAQALQAAFDDLYPDQHETTIVDFFTDIAGWPFSTLPATYTRVQRWPTVWKMLYLWAKFGPTRLLTEEMGNLIAHNKVREAILQYHPSVIISVHPMVQNMTVRVLNRITRLHPPFVTVVTDFGDAHPMWFHEESDACYVPTDYTNSLAHQAGLRDEQIRQFGLPVRQDFWSTDIDKTTLRQELGMRLDAPAVLVVSGGDGVGGMEKIAIRIADAVANDAGGRGQIVVVCGKNDKLRNRLRRRVWPIHVVVMGYITNMGDWMGACDCIVTKAGPGTIAEALIRGMPLILSSYLPGQEEGNVDFVVNNEIGVYTPSSREIGKTVAAWFVDLELLEGMSERARSVGRPESSRNIARDIWKVMKRSSSGVMRQRNDHSPRQLRYRVSGQCSDFKSRLVRNKLRLVILIIFIFGLCHFFVRRSTPISESSPPADPET